MHTQNTLENFRQQIDSIDKEIACLLAQRMAVSDQIGVYKRKNNISVQNESREQQVVFQVVSETDMTFADSVRTVYKAIFAESRARQNRIR